jgi:FolB domain-containing protein
MDTIALVDLEVFYRVGVPDEERAQPQRLLLTIEMELDFRPASAMDRLEETIDYFNVAQRLLAFGEGRSWRLIEKLASDIADLVLVEYRPVSVRVEVKKFPIPQAQYVAVRVSRGGSPLERRPARE